MSAARLQGVARRLACLLLSFWQCALAAEEIQSDNIPPEPYIDQLIDPDVADEPFDEEWLDTDREPQGRRFRSLEYRHYQERQDVGNDAENGIELEWRRETLNYGEFDLRAGLRHGDDQRFSQDSGSVFFALRQTGFPLDERHIMHNDLGVLRSNADPLVTSSFRFNLPSTLLAGGQTHIEQQGLSSLYISTGRIGRLDTGQVQGFETDRGKQAAIGYSRQLDNQWRTGVHLVHLDGSRNTPDHQSLASAIEYSINEGAERYTGHLLVDSEKQYGMWADGDNRVGRWRHRYGLFRFEPELLWAESAPVNDQQGGYLRTEMHTLRYDITAGLDLAQTDIENDPLRAGNNLYNIFFNGNWRMNRKTSLGGTLTVRGSEGRDGLAGDDMQNVIVSAFTTYAFPVGTTRVQLDSERIEEGREDGSAWGVTWDQDWNLMRLLSR